jgi:hypothetical protein
MPLSWNEIKHRAIKFGNDWKNETREAAERQTFWNEFFDVFGIRRRTVASFEEPVKKLSGNWGAIDVFWPGKLLGEHKSAGQDLDKAHAQGMAYVRGLLDNGREKEVPRYLIVSDFVDRCYRKEPFTNDRARVEHLFALYEKLTAPIIPTTKKTRSRKA